MTRQKALLLDHLALTFARVSASAILASSPSSRQHYLSAASTLRVAYHAQMEGHHAWATSMCARALRECQQATTQEPLQ